jgi:hypothetical protein
MNIFAFTIQSDATCDGGSVSLACLRARSEPIEGRTRGVSFWLLGANQDARLSIGDGRSSASHHLNAFPSREMDVRVESAQWAG